MELRVIDLIVTRWLLEERGWGWSRKGQVARYAKM